MRALHSVASEGKTRQKPAR